MRRQAAPRRAWLRRRGWLWPDRNPLRRGCDRAEALISAGLVAAFVIGGPLAALAAGGWASHSGLRAGQVRLKHWQVDCQVVQAALLAVIVLALVLAGAGLAVRYLLDRRRLAAWDAQWRATGPKWSHHG
jgi:hypothetical protein